MPLDFKPERRFVMGEKRDDTPLIRIENTYASHFATCPHADAHRRRTGH
jgi:hypothetical protein